MHRQIAGYDRILKIPYRGAGMTVEVLKDAALRSQDHFSVRLLAEEVIEDLDSKDYLSEILAIYYFTLGLTRYANDPRTVELVRAPYVVAGEILAGKRPSLDCDDMVALMLAMLLAVGREVRIVTAAFQMAYYQGQLQYSHVFAEAREPRTGQWIVLDPVAAETTNEMLSRIKAKKIWPVA